MESIKLSKEEYLKWFTEEISVFLCQKCGAPCKSIYCDSCFGETRCRACGRKSYGKEFCYYCFSKAGRKR